MMIWLWHTKNLPMLISIDAKGDVCMYMDGAHAVHVYGKGNSKLFATMGRGA